MYDLFAFIFQNSFLLRGMVLFFLGLIIGSFLNVVIYRLPLMLQLEETKLNLFYPSSHCTNCKHSIPVWANIPLLSYFILNGKCGFCKTNISIRYPLVELVTSLLFILAGYFTSDVVILPAFLVFISFSICLIFIDFDTFLLPDELTLTLLWLGLLFNLHGAISITLINAVVGAVIGYILLWSIYWVFKLLTNRDGMGYGDFKFLAAILAWVGYQGLVPVLLISSMLGIVYYVIAKLSGKLIEGKSGHIPFGPFLGLAGIVLVLGGQYINLDMFLLA